MAKALADRMSEPDVTAPLPTPVDPGTANVTAEASQSDEPAAHATAQPKPERAPLSPEMVQAEVAALATLTSQLQVAAQSDRLRLLDAGLKELRNADRRLSRLPQGTREALAADFAVLKSDITKRIAEVKQGEEWKRWVNVQRLEKLCVQAEVLRDVLPEFPDKEQAPAELAALKSTWRSSTGPVHPAKREELWARFKGACDAVMAIVVKSRPGAVDAAAATAGEVTPQPPVEESPEAAQPSAGAPPAQELPAPALAQTEFTEAASLHPPEGHTAAPLAGADGEGQPH
jgi:hypothetical protein